MLFKTCPRCRGDIYTEEGFGYREFVCLQCGWRRDPKRQVVEFGHIEGTHRIKTPDRLAALAS